MAFLERPGAQSTSSTLRHSDEEGLSALSTGRHARLAECPTRQMGMAMTDFQVTANRATPAVAEDAADRLERLVLRLANRKNIGQVVIGVSTTDESFSWKGAAGVGPDEESFQPDTPFWIASVTKLFTATAVLSLSERGDLELDRSIREYLPPDVVDGLHQGGGTDRSAEITIRHLLSHTSGLADYWDDLDGDSIYRRLARGEDFEWTFQDVVRATRAAKPTSLPRT
jgi:D-alanyl-D-alanine carboxypeptidase